MSSLTSSFTEEGVVTLEPLAGLSGVFFSTAVGTCLLRRELSPNWSDLFSSQSSTTLNMEVLTRGFTGLDVGIKNMGSEVPLLDGVPDMM